MHYTVTVTLTVKAESEQDAWKQAEYRLKHGIYEGDAIQIEQEEEA